MRAAEPGFRIGGRVRVCSSAAVASAALVLFLAFRALMAWQDGARLYDWRANAAEPDQVGHIVHAQIFDLLLCLDFQL
jgi:hypothetical protein